MIPITTARLQLREFGPDDVDALFAFRNDPRYWEHLPMDPPTLERTRSVVEKAQLDVPQAPRERFVLAAVDTASGQLVGEGFLIVTSAAWQQAEIGWGLHADHAGRGLGTEIGAAMRDHAFDVLGMHRVQAECRMENQASRRIMQKLGMREEGVSRDNVLARGQWWSSVRCAMLAHERRQP